MPRPLGRGTLLDLSFEAGAQRYTLERYAKAGLPFGSCKVFSYYFPDGQIYLLPYDEAAKLARGRINVLAIPGDLGAGDWKELGEFLFEAATQWRTGVGDPHSLIRRCEALIGKRKKAGDLQWAGNLVFVREHWLRANPRAGNYGREPKQARRKELKELPWGNTRRTFAGPFELYSIEPYRAFKEVLKVNPGDQRALFWTQVLPWMNGFAPEAKPGEPTSDDLIRECKRVYMAHRDQMDDFHRFWALKEFMRAAYGATYVERYHLHLKGIRHGEDLSWALDDLEVLFKRWPFLRYQLDELGKWLAYMTNPDWVDPLKPVRTAPEETT